MMVDRLIIGLLATALGTYLYFLVRLVILWIHEEVRIRRFAKVVEGRALTQCKVGSIA